MICETTDYQFPLLADVYHPLVEQGAYGNVSRQWIHDRTIAISVFPDAKASQADVRSNIDVTYKTVLIGRVRGDLRVSSTEKDFAVTNVIVSNIRDSSGNHIYTETSGPRSGKSTLFEIASSQPFVGPFGSVEFFKISLRRSDNQGAEV
jgi:hypothetical protein